MRRISLSLFLFLFPCLSLFSSYPDVATWYLVETRYPASLCRWRRAFWWKCRLSVLHAFDADYNIFSVTFWPICCKILLIIRIVTFLRHHGNLIIFELSYRCSKVQIDCKVFLTFCKCWAKNFVFLTCWYLHYQWFMYILNAFLFFFLFLILKKLNFQFQNPTLLSLVKKEILLSS